MCKLRYIYICIINRMSFFGFASLYLSSHNRFLKALERCKLLFCLHSRFYLLCKMQSTGVWYIDQGLLLYPWYIPLQIWCHDLENKSFWTLAFLCSDGKAAQSWIPCSAICVFNNWSLLDVLVWSKGGHRTNVTHFFQDISSLYKINLSIQP